MAVDVSIDLASTKGGERESASVLQDMTLKVLRFRRLREKGMDGCRGCW
jgi:hypothetical protein